MLQKIMTLLLILSVLPTKQDWGEEKPPIEVKMLVFPREVAIGDTCYVLVEVTNNSEEIIQIREPEFYLAIKGQLVQFSLSREEKTWYGTFECDRILGSVHIFLPDFLVASGESIAPLALSLQFPPLDELHTPFWEETLKELQDHPEGLVFDFWIKFSRPSWGYPLLFDEDFQKKMNEVFAKNNIDRQKLGLQTNQVTIKLRNAEEMAMIEQWYQNTPTRYFPIISKHGSYLDLPLLLKHPTRSMPYGLRREPSNRRILDHNPWFFVTIGNRYPGYPNNPETWQGWKELEENISPSTMCDEIRLTRILIQYCDTKDEKVLDELKEWFAGMNEVQRTCMAKSVWDRVKGCYGYDALLPSFRDLYFAIRENDIAAKTESEIEWLKKLELLE